MENTYNISKDLYEQSEILGKWSTLSPFMRTFYSTLWGSFALIVSVRGRPIRNALKHGATPEESAKLLTAHKKRAEHIRTVLTQNRITINEVTQLIPVKFITEYDEWKEQGDDTFVYRDDAGTITLKILLKEWPIELLEDKEEYVWYQMELPVELTTYIGENISRTTTSLPIQVYFSQCGSPFMRGECFADVIERLIKEVEVR